MRYSSWIVAAMVLLSVAGWWISHHLTALHFQDAPASGFFADVCAPDGAAAYDCKVVVKSKWAVWPPVEPDPVSGELPGDATPVALFGWWYFTGVGLWYLLVGRCDPARRGWHLLLLVGVIAGCAVSAFYLYILLATDMPARCLWCMISHGINFLLLIGTIMLFPRKPRAGDATGSDVEAGEAPAEAAHPSGRLVLAALVAFLGMTWWETALTRAGRSAILAAQKDRESKQYQMMLHDFYRDDENLWARFESQEPATIPLRADDPRRGEGDMLLPMVVFSDFQCPACRDFAERVEKNLTADFGNLLRVYWKHLPWGTACNENSARDMHPQACAAAAAAEAARVLGGNDAFWKAHDALFARQRELAKLDYRVLAGELGLDPERFVETMASEDVKARIQEDIVLAKTLGVKATPMVYLWGRKVDRHMLMNPAFVKRISDRFQQVRNQKLAQQKWEGLSPEQRAEMLRKAEQQVQEQQVRDPNAPSPTPGETDGHDHDHGAHDGHDHSHDPQ